MEIDQPAALDSAARLGLQRRGHRAAALVPEDDEQRRRQMFQRISEASEDLGPHEAETNGARRCAPSAHPHPRFTRRARGELARLSTTVEVCRGID
jgi:hypothetical protein